MPLALKPLSNQAAADSSVPLEVERHRGAVAGKMADAPDDNLMQAPTTELFKAPPSPLQSTVSDLGS